MQFRIADTFTASLGRLPNEQQRAAKTTAFDLQTNPSQPGLSVHRLSNTRDTNFWSARVNVDLRIIFHPHRRACCALLRRAPRRGVPVGGAAQVGTPPCYWRGSTGRTTRGGPGNHGSRLRGNPGSGSGQTAAFRPPFRTTNFLVTGYPKSGSATSGLQTRTLCWIWQTTCLPRQPRHFWSWPWASIRNRRSLHRRVPTPLTIPTRCGASASCATSRSWPPPWSTPGRNGRYSSIPSSRQWSNGVINGPARVSGSAGTGKTVVALHRAAYLARVNPSARVLLPTFSDALARLLQTKLGTAGQPRRQDPQPHHSAIVGRGCVGPIRQMVRETPTGKPARRGKTHRGSRRMAWQQFFYYLSVDGMGSSRRWLAVGYMGGLPWHPTRGALSSALRIAARDAVADIRMGQSRDCSRRV